MQRYFWPLAALVLAVLIAVLIAGLVLGFVLVGDRTQDLRTELNDDYVEQIDLRSVPAGGGRYEDIIVLDDVPRYDCSEEDGRLDCSDDPQPTPEGSGS